MGAPHLQLVDGDDPTLCGAPTARGEPCQNTAQTDGRCWIASHKDPGAVAADGAPDLPPHLQDSRFGGHYWRYHVGRCSDAGVLGRVDMTVIEKAAEVADIIRRCWNHVDENGPTVPGKGDSVKTNPALSKYNSLVPEYRQLTKQIDAWVEGGSERDESSGGGWTDW